MNLTVILTGSGQWGHRLEWGQPISAEPCFATAHQGWTISANMKGSVSRVVWYREVSAPCWVNHFGPLPSTDWGDGPFRDFSLLSRIFHSIWEAAYALRNSDHYLLLLWRVVCSSVSNCILSSSCCFLSASALCRSRFKVEHVVFIFFTCKVHFTKMLK